MVESLVLCCGLATLDVVQTVTWVPEANEKVTALGLDVSSGGPATNAAVVAAALGCRTRLVTALGVGPLAGLIRADLTAWDVEVIDVGDPGMSPPVSTVLVTESTGDRAVVSTNASMAQVAACPDTGLLDGVGIVLIDGHHLSLCLAVTSEAVRRGIPVLLDGGSWKPGLEELLRLVDIAVLSGDFVVPAAVRDGAGDTAMGRNAGGEAVYRDAEGGDVLDTVSSFGPKVVAQSHGSGPIQILAVGTRSEVLVPKVQVLDSLGAGDVLHGALAAYLAVALAAPVAPIASSLGAVSPGAVLPGAVLPGAVLPGTNSAIAGSSAASLPDAELPHADLPHADLPRADHPDGDLPAACLPDPDPDLPAVDMSLAGMVLGGLDFAGRAASVSCSYTGARGWLKSPALKPLRAEITSL